MFDFQLPRLNNLGVGIAENVIPFTQMTYLTAFVHFVTSFCINIVETERMEFR